MIGQRMLELAVRRERLLMRAQSQRVELAQAIGGLAGPIALIDRMLSGARWLRAHPGVVVAGAVLLAVAKPRGAFALARGGLRLWAAWRALRAPQKRVAWALLPRVVDIVRAVAARVR